MKKLILLFAASLMIGCTGPHGALNELPAISSAEKAGTVYIVRNGNLLGGGVNYAVTLNGREIFGISINEYTKFEVEQGQHTIGVICKGGWAPGTHINEKPAVITAGQSHYFMARAGGVCAVIEPLTVERGEKIVAKAKYIAI